MDGKVALVLGSGGREDVSAAFGTRLGLGEAFTATFDLIVSGIAQNSGYLASFKDGGASGVSARLFVTPPTIAGGDFSLGISNTGLSADSILFLPFSFGVTYPPSLSINAAGLGSLAFQQSTVTTNERQREPVSTFALHQRNGSATQVIDDLVVTRSDPEPASSLTLLVGAGLLGILRHRTGRK